MKFVQWCEPFDGGDDPPTIVCRMTLDDAVRAQRRVARLHEHEYESDERALEDFLAVHWAEVIDEG